MRRMLKKETNVKLRKGVKSLVILTHISSEDFYAMLTLLSYVKLPEKIKVLTYGISDML